MRNLIIKCFILFSFTLHSQHDLKQEIKEIELQINTTESQISAVGKRKEIAEKVFNLKYTHTRGHWTATPTLIKVEETRTKVEIILK